MAETAVAGINVPVEDLGLKFINQIWRILFGVYGLQLDVLDREIYRSIHAQVGIHSDCFSNITALGDYCVILVYCYWFMDAMIVYFVHLCQGLALNFVLFSRCLEAELRATSLLSSKLNALRHQYEYISGLVDEISHVFSPLVLLWLLSFVSNLCLDIRAIKAMASIYGIRLYHRYIIHFCRGLIFLLLILRMAGQINTQAHLMRRKLFAKVIDDKKMNEAFYTNYLLFCEVINSCNIGISVSGLFTLKVSSILTIAGTVLTYTIVLYQT